MGASLSRDGRRLLSKSARCGRTHCYITAPLFLLAAVFVALSGFRLVPLRPGLFLFVVFGACLPRVLCRDSAGQVPKPNLISVSGLPRSTPNKKDRRITSVSSNGALLDANQELRGCHASASLHPLCHRAVGCSRLPRAGVVDPSVAANYGSRSMRAVERGVICKLIMGDSSV
jgi:hypothetical protein